jgi:hypothetical protein
MMNLRTTLPVEPPLRGRHHKAFFFFYFFFKTFMQDRHRRLCHACPSYTFRCHCAQPTCWAIRQARVPILQRSLHLPLPADGTGKGE